MGGAKGAQGRRGWLAAGILLVFFGLLLAHAWHYLPFLSDDALISLRYADRLLGGHGLNWTDGRPVEGYSNLMWILLVSAPGWLGVDLVAAARAMGLLGMATVIGCVVLRYGTGGRSRAETYGLAIGLLFFVGVAPTAAWAIGGLEQPLVAAALACATVLHPAALGDGRGGLRARVALSLALGILCVTRPDGPLYTVAAVLALPLAGVWPIHRRWWTLAPLLVLAPVLFYGGQMAFRVAYYGEWVPNTALVKFTPSVHHALGGLRYVAQGLAALAPASAAALGLLALGLARPASRARFAFPLVALTVWLAYLVLIGGDIFPAHRHFVPVVVLLTVVLIEGVILATALLAGRSRSARGAVTAAVAVAVGLTVLRQAAIPENRAALEERWEWQGRALALTLREAFGRQRPLMAVTAAGCLPYWSRFPCLDMMGLSDYYLPRHAREPLGGGWLGHELGDGDYVLRCAPDLIVFHVGTGPAFRSGIELHANPEFHRRYARMPVRTAFAPAYTAQVYFRVDSPRVGWARQPDGLFLPAHFFNAFEATEARLRDGRLVVDVSARQPAGVVVDAVPADGEVIVNGPPPGRVLPVLTPTPDGRTRIVLTVPGGAAETVTGITLQNRLDPPGVSCDRTPPWQAPREN